jgi:hypothetical protein
LFNADATTKEQTERSDSMRHLVVKSVFVTNKEVVPLVDYAAGEMMKSLLNTYHCNEWLILSDINFMEHVVKIVSVLCPKCIGSNLYFG